MPLFGSPKHPKGPSLKRSRSHALDFSGTQVTFCTPRHSEQMVSYKPKPKKYNLYEPGLFGANDDVKNDVPWRVCYTEGWSFFGWPLIQGRIGDLSLSITAFHNDRHGSLFRPCYFEQSIIDRLYVSKGPGSSEGTYLVLPHSRVNWSVTPINGVSWAHYDVSNRDDLHGSTAWVIPLSDEHSLYFFFTRLISYERTQLNTAYDRLIDHIMQSVTIDWSPEALRMQQAAKQQWPDETLSPNLPEIEWDEADVRAYHQQQEDDFDKEIAEIEARHGSMQA